MIFGIGGGLFFGYFPFIRVADLALVTYRSWPGTIFKNAVKRLGGQYKTVSYRRAEEAEAELDRIIAAGVPVGVRTGMYWLPYIAASQRVQFNAHHLVVFAKEGDEYLISDSVMPGVVRCDAKDVRRARFSPGAMAPRGRMYYPTLIPKDVDWASAILPAIRGVCDLMAGFPFPIIGVAGMRFLASRMVKWPQRMNQRRAMLQLGLMIRAQEEWGTGGAGFRYIYAAFLQEAGGILKKPALAEMSRDLTAIGDRWREFAVLASRICKERSEDATPYLGLSVALLEIAGRERQFYRNLREASL